MAGVQKNKQRWRTKSKVNKNGTAACIVQVHSVTHQPQIAEIGES